MFYDLRLRVDNTTKKNQLRKTYKINLKTVTKDLTGFIHNCICFHTNLLPISFIKNCVTLNIILERKVTLSANKFCKNNQVSKFDKHKSVLIRKCIDRTS